MAFRLTVQRLIATDPMLIAAALFVATMAQPPQSGALATVRVATHAVETDSVAPLEAKWQRKLNASNQDREALLGLATLARLTYRFERADTLAQQLLGSTDAVAPLSGTPDDYTIMARIAVASLIVGRSPLRADSVLAQAQKDAQRIGAAQLESTVLVSLASLRSRTRGARVGLALLEESRRKYPKATPPEEALRLCSEAGLGALTGDKSAELKLNQGIAMARTSKSWRIFADCRMQQAQMLETRGVFDTSLDMLDQATTWLRHLHADAALAISLQRSAYLRLQRGQFARARTDYFDALQRARRARNASVEAWAYSGLAEIALNLNDLSGARQYLDLAMPMHRAANDRWGMAAVQYLHGELYDALGDISAARQSLTGAVDAYASLQQPASAIAPLRRIARLELSQNKADDAERALNRATEYAKATRNSGWFAELPYHQAGVALLRRQLTTADSLLQKITVDSLSSDLAYSYWIRSAEIAARRTDFTATERAMDNAMQVLARWREAFADKDVRLRIAEARRSWGTVGPEYAELIARLAKGDRIAPAFALAEASRARELASVALQQAAVSNETSREALTVARLRKTRASATVADVQRALDDSTALLAYVAGRGDAPTTVFVVTRTAVSYNSLAPVDSISPLVDRYLRLAADGAEPTALATRLGEAVLNAPIASLPKSVTRLIVVPELSLYRVPFDALQMSDGRYVVERFSVAVAPSVTFALSSGAAVSGKTGSLLAFGDVLFGDKPSSGNQKDAAARGDDVRGLPRLPSSGTEARRIASYSASSTVLVRGLASERALRTTSLANVRVLHLATHAIVDDRSLQRSVLALAASTGYDGSVSPDELGALHLNRALVVLSGCKTVGGVVLGGEGLRGFIAPLLEAGAAAVIATQWPIGDESILPMIDRFYWHAARGVDVATALRRAKLDAVRDGVKPAVWAAFALVGDGSLRVPLKSPGAAPLPWAKAATSAPRSSP